jgi:hypothetical protein
MVNEDPERQNGSSGAMGTSSYSIGDRNRFFPTQPSRVTINDTTKSIPAYELDNPRQRILSVYQAPKLNLRLKNRANERVRTTITKEDKCDYFLQSWLP